MNRQSQSRNFQSNILWLVEIYKEDIDRNSTHDGYFIGLITKFGKISLNKADFQKLNSLVFWRFRN